MSLLQIPPPKTKSLPQLSKGAQTGHLIASEEASEPHDGVAGLYTRVKHTLIGNPLPTAHLAHERIPKLKALAVFASDALSSVAYGTEEILLVLVTAGMAALNLTLPIAVAIAALLAIVAYSYRQTIHRYPQGGGTYNVTKDNFGFTPALIAGSSLLIDYVLTVAVSISAGVSAVTSAFPGLLSYRVELALLALLFIGLVNLRGVKDSATVFALPTYLFIFSMLTLIGVGFWKVLIGAPPVEAVAGTLPQVVQPLTLFLVLRAFSSGCSALTGTEAISDGVPAFREPQSRNAAITLIWMASILGVMFLGISFLAQHFSILPHEGETVVSQLARAVMGRNGFYYFLQATTALILFLAANTSFADFPRLTFFMAQDRFLPRQFVFRGDRLALSTGIIALTCLSGCLILIVHAEVHRLIPLYAVGVFTSFTFSQAGMVKRWWTKRETGWRSGMIINGIGALTTGIVASIIVTTKFTHGAWMIVLLLPCFVFTFKGVRSHYERVAKQFRLEDESVIRSPLPPSKTIVLVGSINRASAQIIRYAQTLSTDVVALHVTDELETAHRLRQKWANQGLSIPLVILESPYRSLVSPVMAYLDNLETEQLETPVTIILSAIVPRHWWEYLLHNQDGWRLKAALFFRPKTVVVDFPFHLDQTA
ncbi:MAG: APC family permease [Bacteroidota bacterium]